MSPDPVSTAPASATRASTEWADRRRRGPTAVAEARERAARLRDAAAGLKALLDRPLASYYLVLGCTLLLLAVGLMMVLSTSTAYDLD
ncbi:MAG TPA: hypothetical protein VMA32_14475, partial [Streptosporangiaceae bacterium]|nr:hypothetical protein [Streptosporangiaceae bacterium]